MLRLASGDESPCSTARAASSLRGSTAADRDARRRCVWRADRGSPEPRVLDRRSRRPCSRATRWTTSCGTPRWSAPRDRAGGDRAHRRQAVGARDGQTARTLAAGRDRVGQAVPARDGPDGRARRSTFETGWRPRRQDAALRLSLVGRTAAIAQSACASSSTRRRARGVACIVGP